MVQYSPKKHSSPRIEGEAEFGGSTRKTSLGLLGNTQTGESGVLLPKELEEILNAQRMGKPFSKFSRQTSTSNETISYNEARAIIKGPEGTEPRVIENASGDYSKSHSSDNLTLAGKDSRGLNLITNMSPSSSTANMKQFNTVTCNSPELFQPGYSPNEERLQQKVGLLQQQVKLLQQELKNILNKPKRGVRVQVNSGKSFSNPPRFLKHPFQGRQRVIKAPKRTFLSARRSRTEARRSEGRRQTVSSRTSATVALAVGTVQFAHLALYQERIYRCRTKTHLKHLSLGT
jgi:hypothetical protein